MNTKTTATKDLAVGATYYSQGTTWVVLEIAPLPTGNYEVLAQVADTEDASNGNTWHWYSTPDRAVELVGALGAGQ